jgi:RimJ/RimL family protein N-acetyltransferase
VQWHLLQVANWRPLAWSFNPVALADGHLVGTQGISADRFAVTRSFITGSWLGQAHQGQGLGREMRAAVLHFGFVGLGAQLANSGAFWDNSASIATSRSLGYEENGVTVLERRGRPAEHISFRLTRERWEQLDRPEVEMEGLDGCLDLFGL